MDRDGADGDGRRSDGASGDPDRESSAPAGLSGRLSSLLRELAHLTPDRLEGEWTAPPAAGQLLAGRYEVVSEIGRGGFGLVYAGLDRELGRPVALKVLRPGAALRTLLGSEALRAEASTAAGLDHPAIVTVHDLGRWSGGLFLVLERLRGEPLDRRLRRGPLPAAEALRIARHVSAALSAAHAAGVIHRDLKPGNVFLTDDGRVKVLDFGLSSGPVTGPGRAGGTRGYASPEQARGEPEDARTDVFAFGVLLHEALSGALPYPVISGHATVLDGAPPPRLAVRGVPGPVARLVRRCLSPDPAGRPRDGRALAADLEVALRESERPARLLRVGALVTVVAALGTALGALLLPGPDEPAAPPVVIVADAVNETGDPALDGAGRLLATALARFRVRVVQRERVLHLLRRAGHGAQERIDGPAASSVAALAGAALVLVPHARRDGPSVALDVTAVDPRTEVAVWGTPAVVREGRASPFRLVDEASSRVREALKVASTATPVERVEDLLTPDPEAWTHYDAGVDCVERTITGDQGACAERFRQALARDPDFALAHYQLALLGEMRHDTGEVQAATLAPALQHVERLPLRERELVLAWSDRIEERVEEARARYARLAAADPDDVEVAWLAAELEWHAGDLALSIPWLEATLRLDPRHEWALDHLVRALGFLGQRERLSALADRLAAAVSPGELHALVRALGWLGEHDRMRAAARREVEAGAASGPGDLLAALVTSGHLDEAERTLRARGTDWNTRTQLAAVLVGQGRAREARAELEAARVEPGEAATALRYRRVSLLAGLGDAEAVRREVEAIGREAPEELPWLSIPLARAGDLALAARLAERLPPEGLALDLHAAVASLRTGDAVAAVRRLRAAPLGRIASDAPIDGPAFLLAEALARADEPDALDALRRYQGFFAPGSFWRPWALPESRVLAAEWLARRGRTAEARAELDVLLRELARADADFPPLVRARALARWLGAR